MHALPIAWERHLTQGGKTLDPKVDLQLWAGVCGEREREGRERIVGQYCQRTGYNYLLQRSGQLPISRRLISLAAEEGRFPARADAFSMNGKVVANEWRPLSLEAAN